MDVILLEDVKALGKKGDLVKVNDGYARNYILPRKLGVEATAKNKNDLKLQKEHQAREEKRLYEEALAFAEDIRDKSIEIPIRVGEGGKVFGSVSTKEIAAAFKQQLDVEIDKRKLSLPEPLKSLGAFVVDYKVHPKVTAKLQVKIREAE